MSTKVHVFSQKGSVPANLLWSAWGATLLISALPNIWYIEFGGGVPYWLIWGKIAFLVVMIVVTLRWNAMRSLCDYFVVLAVIYLTTEFFFRVSSMAWWHEQFYYEDASFSVAMLGDQFVRLAISFATVATLLLLGFHRADFFLSTGRLDALAKPARLLGMKDAEPWTRFGWKFLLGSVVALGTFLGVAGWQYLGRVPQVLPLLPIVVLLASLNAFNEELVYRAALLAPLHMVIGDRQAIYLSATLFGLAHYTGVPYGVTGVLMATFLGWALGKSMIETKGFVWAWSIHFVMDVMIFCLMAVGSITAGGA